MTAERVEIHIKRLHIDSEMRNTLRAIHQNQRADFVRGVGELPDWIDRAQHVRALRDGDEFCARIHLRYGECAVGIQIDTLDNCTGRGGDLIPRHDIAVVFHPSDEDFVAGFDIRSRPRIGDEVDGFGGSTRENNGLWCRCVDEFCDSLTGEFVFTSRTFGKGVNAPVNIGVIAPVVIVHRVNDLPGFL